MFGYLRQDDDGHWYLIPEEKTKLFRDMQDRINCAVWDKRDDFIDEFIEKFDQYRLSGGVEDIKIPMESD